MPTPEKKPQADRLRFLADRLALLMTELVERDLDYGAFCHDEFYTGKRADEVRDSKAYEVSIDFVRKMLRRHDEKSGMGAG